MKAYKVNVNGNVYEITLEIIDKEDIKTTEPVKASPATPATAGGTSVSAPMPGTILRVNVANGQAIKKGDVLMVLEAMKMENEIMAANDGVVTSVCVQDGASVTSGTVLCTIQ